MAPQWGEWREIAVPQVNFFVGYMEERARHINQPGALSSQVSGTLRNTY